MNTRSGALIVGISALILAGIVLYLMTSKTKEPSVPAVENYETFTPPIPAEEPPPTEKEIQEAKIKAQPTIQPSSVKQIGDNHWRIHLTSKEWFDSGIPSISNQYTKIKAQEGKGWLTKIGDKVFIADSNSQDIATDENLNGHPGMTVDYDFRDTFKFKLDEESGANEVVLVITFFDGNPNNNCAAPRDDAHGKVHENNQKWRDTILSKIARK